ncbi:MAG: TRAP transporter permease, partial [Candidatus Competibacterales bacterium]|nr:TRAP transporter permease [Candidatus Competibacterales bacterium]
MSEDKSANNASDKDLQDLVAQTDTGARTPSGPAGKVIIGAAILWSLFQLWYASPLPFLDWPVVGSFGVFNSTEARSIHLAFAIFLAFLAYPALGRSPRDHIPLQDWILALVGAFCAGYLYLFYDQLSGRPGAPITQDIVVACIGMVLLLEATRRALGPPLMIIATIFLIYTFAGPHMPSLLAHQGESLASVANHQWITTEGVFGIALGVSTDFVFLFVLFGALLDKAGAGNYVIKVAFSLMGHMRGGPAKAAVVSSGLTGLISGSSIANVVTTGTFTIPLMKRVGFTSEKAGAVEVASSVNGQIMPPVMGAAAFLMVEYVGISYFDVVKHAFLPALISYIALVYIVHLEAMKMGMKGLPRAVEPKPWVQRLMGFLIGFILVCALAFGVYYGIGWLRPAFGDAASWIVAAGIAVIYLVLVIFGSRYPELEQDDPNAPVVKLPEPGPTVKVGLHFILPVVVLIWCLMVERLSPGLSAFWATVLMIFILLTQRPLTALFRGGMGFGEAVAAGWTDFVLGLIAGARNMIGIGIATATAGVIVGVVSQTGVGAVLADLVEVLSFGNLLLILILTAILSLILGMGLPTTANYIVVSSLLAPVIVTLGVQNGLIVPLIAVHLFVFYFGIMADVTPPVGLASFAAAAVSGGDPIRTGLVAFFYSLRTALLPFLFIFNTDLLLIDVDFLHGV